MRISLPQNRKKNMKTSVRNFVKIALISTFALAMVAALPLRSSAAEQIKGAQKMVTGPAVSSVAAAPVKAMSCPLCVDKQVTSSTAAGRGAFIKTTTSTQHLCPSCKTAIETLGRGKQAAEIPVHSCSSGAVASCCAVN
jgi:hypothetical protein